MSLTVRYVFLSVLFIVLVSGSATGCQDSAKSSTAAGPTAEKPPAVTTPSLVATAVSTQPSTPIKTTGPFLIAFSTGDGIGVATADGKDVRLIASGPENYGPVWSPDAKKIAYIVRAPREKIGLYVYSLADDSSSKVAGEAGLFMGYSWSPDSKRLAYNNNSTDAMGIYSVDIATGASVRLSPKEDAIAEPSWSPDGKWVAFHYTGPSGSGVRIVSPDGSTSKEIAKGSFVDAPAWSPDSQKVPSLISLRRATSSSWWWLQWMVLTQPYLSLVQDVPVKTRNGHRMGRGFSITDRWCGTGLNTGSYGW